MTKNTKTYLLLGVVLFVWGTIGYKFISTLSPESIVDNEEIRPNFKPKPLQERDTFSILANYRDPFLGTFPPQKKQDIKNVSSRDPKKKVPEISIDYTGLITDSATRQKIFFVAINGQHYLMKLNDKIQEVHLISGNADAIRIRYLNTAQTIALQK